MKLNSKARAIQPMGRRKLEVVSDDKKHLKQGQVKEIDNFTDRDLGTDVYDNLQKILNNETLRQNYHDQVSVYQLQPESFFSKSGECQKLSKVAISDPDTNEMFKRLNKEFFPQLQALDKLKISQLPNLESVKEEVASDDQVKDLIRAAIKYIEKKLEL